MEIDRESPERLHVHLESRLILGYANQSASRRKQGVASAAAQLNCASPPE